MVTPDTTRPLRPLMRLCGALASVAVTAGLLACQPLPRPFAHQGGLDRDILRIADGAGIYVAPAVFEITDEAGVETTTKLGGLAEATVAALLRADLVATTGSVRNDSNFVVKPVVTADTMRWTLFDAEQAVIGEFVRPIGPADLTALRTPATDVERRFNGPLDDAARYFVDRLKGEDVAPKELEIHVAQVVGAPGSGNLELTQFMRNVLAGIDGLTIVNAAAGTLAIVGTVRLGAPENGTQDIEISWALRDRDGAELGTIDQANRIPAGSLDGQWGDTARQITLAAASGLTQMLARIPLDDAERPAR